jgi:hypothetical protein
MPTPAAGFVRNRNATESQVTFKLIQPGIYRDVAAVDYFADPCPTPSLTQSIAKILLERSPAHARLEHPKLAPPHADDDEPAEKYEKVKAIGNAAHALLIGRGKELAVLDFDSFRKDKAKEARDEAEAAGKTPVLFKHKQIAADMVMAARLQMDGHPAAPLFRQGAGEVVLAWKEGDLWFRAMVDWLHDDLTKVDDYKTTGLCCAPHVVADRPGEMGWDIQAAMIERGLDALDPDGAGRRRFRFINQENEPPFALTVIEISESDMTMGRKKLAMAVDIWSRCMASSEWPAYPAETVLSRPRGWTEARWLEREVAYADAGIKRKPMLTSLAGG